MHFTSTKSKFSIPTPLLPLPTNTHARGCVHLHTKQIIENLLQLHHSAWHIKKYRRVFVFVCALGFFRLNLTFPMETRAVIYRNYLGRGFGCADTVLAPCLTYAVMKGVKVQGRLL